MTIDFTIEMNCTDIIEKNIISVICKHYYYYYYFFIATRMLLSFIKKDFFILILFILLLALVFLIFFELQYCFTYSSMFFHFRYWFLCSSKWSLILATVTVLKFLWFISTTDLSRQVEPKFAIWSWRSLSYQKVRVNPPLQKKF